MKYWMFLLFFAGVVTGVVVHKLSNEDLEPSHEDHEIRGRRSEWISPLYECRESDMVTPKELRELRRVIGKEIETFTAKEGRKVSYYFKDLFNGG